MNTCSIVEKWYRKLSFPTKYDAAFESALTKIEVPADATVDAYDKKSEDGIKNLLYYLYFCENVEKIYAKRGIPENILIDTLRDLVIWTEIWSDIKGTLYLGELAWLSHHLSGKLFKVERLQFCFPPATEEGYRSMEIHIPAVGKLSREASLSSIEAAKRFFATYFPEYEYDRFTCESWLLDETLKKYLAPESNIIMFGDLFTRVSSSPSDALLGYIFRWNATRETIKDIKATSSFAERIREAVFSGETFFCTFGYITK